MAIDTVTLAFTAGVLSILSPCVLPILPVVLGAAASEHRGGPIALAAGLCVSFVAIGLFAATIGYSIGLDADVFRNTAAVLIIAVGTVLLVPAFQARLALAGAPLAQWSDQYFGGARRNGFAGQISIGLLLGAVWSPCVGPTLGAASILAAQGRNLGEVAVTMLAFGLGAALPLATLGLLSRATLQRWRTRLITGGARAKVAFALVLVAMGVLVLTGLDKRLETFAVDQSPQWVTDLTTRI
ncbi:MAG TPA: cytochrome c biogenesis CcdA family protein [Xanthobacteraceae bacterium]|jgi:cytochrome c biogenesis protein CcdA